MGNPQSRFISALDRTLVQATLTRPDNTTAYAAGDVIADKATEPSVASIVVGRVSGGGGIIRSAKVVGSANQATKADLEIWLFSVEPTAMEDNAAFDPTDAELLKLVAILDMGSTPTEGNVGSGADGNVVYQKGDLAVPFACAPSDQNLYWVLVVRNSYTPVAQEALTLILGVERD
jgi:hypothetical protein